MTHTHYKEDKMDYRISEKTFSIIEEALRKRIIELEERVECFEERFDMPSLNNARQELKEAKADYGNTLVSLANQKYNTGSIKY